MQHGSLNKTKDCPTSEEALQTCHPDCNEDGDIPIHDCQNEFGASFRGEWINPFQCSAEPSAINSDNPLSARGASTVRIKALESYAKI